MKYFSFLLLALLPFPALAGVAGDELRTKALELDAIVFESGYNQCDIDELGTVVTDDLEFYHDQGGPLFSGQAFLDSMQKGICELDYKARRELVGKLEVFPLYNNGELYGMISRGKHRFHAKYPGKAEYPSGEALFNMLWLLKEGEWKLARTQSFAHVGLD